MFYVRIFWTGGGRLKGQTSKDFSPLMAEEENFLWWATTRSATLWTDNSLQSSGSCWCLTGEPAGPLVLVSSRAAAVASQRQPAALTAATYTNITSGAVRYVLDVFARRFWIPRRRAVRQRTNNVSRLTNSSRVFAFFSYLLLFCCCCCAHGLCVFSQ